MLALAFQLPPRYKGVLEKEQLIATLGDRTISSWAIQYGLSIWKVMHSFIQYICTNSPHPSNDSFLTCSSQLSVFQRHIQASYSISLPLSLKNWALVISREQCLIRLFPFPLFLAWESLWKKVSGRILVRSLTRLNGLIRCPQLFMFSMRKRLSHSLSIHGPFVFDLQPRSLLIVTSSINSTYLFKNVGSKPENTALNEAQ